MDEQFASAAADRATTGLVVLRDGLVAWVNDAARELVEPHGETWAGSSSLRHLLRTAPPGGGPIVLSWQIPRGSSLLWQVACTAIDGPQPALLYEIHDQTALLQPERLRSVTTPDRRLDRIEALAGMGSWVWDIPTGRLEWSAAMLRMYGLPSDSAPDHNLMSALVHPDDVAPMNAALADCVNSGKPVTYTYRIRPVGGEEQVLECHGEVFANDAGEPVRVLGTARNVTEEHHARAELAYLAEHDPLTGIANRRRITNRLAECAADPAGATLLLIDIDHFKDVNDLRGHGVGDRVIRHIAETVLTRLEPGALLGRLGGDEFAVVLPFHDPGYGLTVGEKICDAVAGEPIREGGAPLRVSVSVGVTGVVRGQGVELSLARADLALYEAKNAGRNRVRLSAPDQFRQAAVRVGLEQRIADALDNGTMQLDAQPIVDLATGVSARWEVLIRLRDELAPRLGPAEFLPAAERTDLVLKVDRWVLGRAIEALAHDAARARGLRLEVNISARSLEDDGLGRWILHRLDRHGVAAERLGLEITETAAITNMAAAQRLAGRLTDAGCRFSLDDFGSGFGSFSHLKHLPFAAVKIAGEFVQQLDTDRVDPVLVGAIARVADELGMRTVAEQVDRAVLVDRLRALGVTDGQGYHFGRPRPLTELLA
jgi:diguanylate cyclase (GGDEF)-like protein/PAS domain S-box-containing protein